MPIVIEEVRELLVERKYDKLFELTKPIKDQNDSDILLLLGEHYYDDQEYDKAIEVFEKMKDIYDGYEPYYFLGQIYSKEGILKNDDLAIIYFEERLNIYESSQDLYRAKMKLVDLYFSRESINRYDVLKVRSYLEQIVGNEFASFYNHEEMEEEEYVLDNVLSSRTVKVIDLITITYLLLGNYTLLHRLYTSLAEIFYQEKFEAFYELSEFYQSDNMRSWNKTKASLELSKFETNLIEKYAIHYVHYGMSIKEILNEFRRINRNLNLSQLGIQI